LPINSYYQIKDAHNDQIIIPYSESTKLNTNTSGSYFDFYTTMMYPERYYKFEIQANFTDYRTLTLQIRNISFYRLGNFYFTD
jgi:hypothetical protein